MPLESAVEVQDRGLEQGKSRDFKQVGKRCERNRILPSILDHIGGTPLVRLNRIGVKEGIECELLVKCEFFNSGGSVKDRIGKRMVEAAERDGILKPGSVLIEPTSGNTGIGLALAAAVKGYRTIITLPEKMSTEKVDVLKALGAEIIRTPNEAAWDSPDSHIGVANRLAKEIPNAWIPNQYANPNNPLAHYEDTALEIYNQCGGSIDMLVCGAGTGGTIAGIARRLKELVPDIVVVGVDPYGSILAQPKELNAEGVHGYQIEGIGYDFVPEVLDRSLVDKWIKTNDKESFLMARRLIREEGLLCGGSSGTAMVGALQAAKGLKKGQRCVVVLPDSVRNYMTNDDWMKRNGFQDAETTKQEQSLKDQWAGATIADLHLSRAMTIPAALSIRLAIEMMKTNGFDQLPVTSASDSKHCVGLVSLGGLLAKLGAGRCNLDDPARKAMYSFLGVGVGPGGKKYVEITTATRLETLTTFFETNASAVVTRRSAIGELLVESVVTKVDLLSFLTTKCAAL